jgi:hypothetical protein
MLPALNNQVSQEYLKNSEIPKLLIIFHIIEIGIPNA